jgi:glycerophosphoryl diester phosphodiesterase
VRDFTAAELRQMDAGSHFDIAFRGEPIPTLDEVLKAVGQLTITNIELKNYDSITNELPEKVAALVKRHKLSRRVIFSSFNPIALYRIRRLIPEAPIGLLTMAGWKGVLARRLVRWMLPYQSLHPVYKDVTPALVKAAHELGQKVFPHTVNQELDMQRLFEMGVDGIFTDDPALALQVVKAARGQLQ